MRDLNLVCQFYALITMDVRRVISECLRKRMVTKARVSLATSAKLKVRKRK